jgi:hypothetical protein
MDIQSLKKMQKISTQAKKTKKSKQFLVSVKYFRMNERFCK